MERWVRQISKTETEEISCSDCLDRISEYVEAELENRATGERFDKVGQHLEQCRVCREEYEVLRDLVDLENHGQAPSIDDLKKSLGAD